MSADVDAVDDAEGDGWDATRRRVLERDDYECRFCGMSDDEHREEHGRGLSAHHIIPDGDGGEDTPANLITVCQSCHRTLESTHAKAVAQLKRDEYDDDDDGAIALSVATHAFKLCRLNSDSLDEKLGEFLDTHPVFSSEFNLYDEEGLSGRTIRSTQLDDMVGDVSSEWSFLVSYGYKRALFDVYVSMDGWCRDVPDTEALAESELPEPQEGEILHTNWEPSA
jgi:hypothetical protein